MIFQSIKLWACSVFLNAVFVAIGALAKEGVVSILFSIAFSIVSAFITCPLIIIIWCLVRSYILSPGNPADKFYWLMFLLVALAGLFLWGLCFIFQINAHHMDSDVKLIIASAIIAVITATGFNRASLSRLHARYHSKQLV